MALRNLRNQLKRRGYEEAVTAYRKDGTQPLKLAHAIRHLGDAHYEVAQTALAEQCFLEALALYRTYEHGPSLDFANAVRRLAVLKDDAGEVDEAIALWQESHDRYVEVNVPMGVAESDGHLALLTHRKGNLPESREWLHKARAAAEASQDPPSLRYVEKVRSLVEK